MNDENLRNVADLPKEERIAFARSGGSVTGSVKKSLAKRLYWLKKKGLSDENCERIHDILTDPQASALDIRLLIEGLKSKGLNAGETLKLGNLMISAHKANFGDKQVNFNVDANSYTVPLETYLKLRTAVMEVCNYEQFHQILELVGEKDE